MNPMERARAFAALHVKGDPLILYNVWDAGSAKAIEEIGAKALATGSWSVAAAHGYGDGEKIPLHLVLSNLRRIVDSVSLPLSVDFEAGYGDSLRQVQLNVAQIIEAGAIGINLEDTIIGTKELRTVDDQCSRINAARSAAESAGIPIFINARTDVFLQKDHDGHSEKDLEEVLVRAKAYEELGASGLFPPGLRNQKLIEKLCAECAVPVNIVMLPGVPAPKRLAELGVSRISYGPKPYRQMIEALKEAGKRALAMEDG